MTRIRLQTTGTAAAATASFPTAASRRTVHDDAEDADDEWGSSDADSTATPDSEVSAAAAASAAAATASAASPGSDWLESQHHAALPSPPRHRRLPSPSAPPGAPAESDDDSETDSDDIDTPSSDEDSDSGGDISEYCRMKIELYLGTCPREAEACAGACPGPLDVQANADREADAAGPVSRGDGTPAWSGPGSSVVGPPPRHRARIIAAAAWQPSPPPPPPPPYAPRAPAHASSAPTWSLPWAPRSRSPILPLSSAGRNAGDEKRGGIRLLPVQEPTTSSTTTMARENEVIRREAAEARSGCPPDYDELYRRAMATMLVSLAGVVYVMYVFVIPLVSWLCSGPRQG